MSGGAGLIDFLIALFGLIIIGAMVFLAIDFVTTDERFKKLAKLAVGGLLVIMFLLDVKAALFGGGRSFITPMGLITFAIGVIVILVVWIIIDWVLPRVLDWFPPLKPAEAIIRIVISALVLIAILVVAANVFFGVGGQWFPNNNRVSEVSPTRVEAPPFEPCSNMAGHQRALCQDHQSKLPLPSDGTEPPICRDC